MARDPVEGKAMRELDRLADLIAKKTEYRIAREEAARNLVGMKKLWRIWLVRPRANELLLSPWLNASELYGWSLGMQKGGELELTK